VIAVTPARCTRAGSPGAAQFVRAGAQFVASRSLGRGALPTVLRKQPVVAWQEDLMFERIATRAVAFGLSGLVTLTLVSALATTADLRHAQACLDYAASTGPVQQVVITGQRLPRS